MKSVWSILLFLFVTLETYCQIAPPKSVAIQTASILYFISGIFIAVLPLIKINPIPSKGEDARILRHFYFIFYVTFLILLTPYAYEWASKIFERFALNYKVADMLPILQIMCQRFLNGDSIYELVHFWEGTEPIYLPAMWLPYVPCTYMGIDIRWTSMLAILIGITFIVFIGKNGKFNFKNLLISLPLYLLIDGILHTKSVLVYLSEEPIVILYYLFLAFSLAKNRPFLIAIALSLCLMSRFALAFWFLMYLVYLFFLKIKNWQ